MCATTYVERYNFYVTLTLCVHMCVCLCVAQMQRASQEEHRKLMKMVSKLQPLSDLLAKWEEKRKV